MIGIFDSGLGGLTAVKEIVEIMPNEDIVYFGDTGRVPYGGRDKETIIKYSKQDVRFLLSKKVRAVLIACGTASTNAIDELRCEFDIPIVGVVDAVTKKACSVTKNKKIGVIGTAATIKTGEYELRIHELLPDAQCYSKPCPLFVPLVENGFINEDNEITRLTVEYYLKELREYGIDTLILGCTHYPIIAPIIAKVMPGVTLINSGREAAKAIADSIGVISSESGEVSYYVSDDGKSFRENASVFMQQKIDKQVQTIDIDAY